MIKIAICDDEEVFLNTLERMIRNYEKTIKEKLLIKRYTKPLYLMDSLAEDFQVFFLDMQMPNMDGFELARVIRKYDEKSLESLHNWSKLTRKEKLNTLQTICNNERDYLGISARIKVGAGSNLTHAYCQYNNKSKEITFDISQLDHASSTTLLEALLHSSYHAYEYALVESYDTMSSDYSKLFDYRIIATYKKEFSTKVTNKAKYYNQINESNARSYATDALQDYQNKLKK